jgi:hypothetical protein
VAVWTELRTAVAGVDPGWERLRLAAVGSASMVLAVALMAGVRAVTGQPVTLVIFAAVLAMISNIAVNESDLGRRRVTTALMLGPAAAAVVAGTLLSPHHVVADVVFVAVTTVAVYVRRFGPRGFALGMAGFMPYFFTQFLQARPAELPWLLVAAVTGLGSTLLLRGFVFVERQDRTLTRLLRAFRAHVHGLVVAVVGVLTAAGGPTRRVNAARRDARRRRARLNTTALRIADQVDRVDEDRTDDGPRLDGLEQQMLDVELAAERLAISVRRLVDVGGPRADDREVLLEGLRGLAAATATGTPHALVPALLDEARHGVAGLTEPTGGDDERTQRVAFAVHRLADVLEVASGEAERVQHPRSPERAAPPDEATGDGPEVAGPEQDRPPSTADGPLDPDVPEDDTGGPVEPATPRTLRLTTRQALQAGVAVALSIIIGELVSPARWYWAAVAAFVVFAGTNSRGDLLTRGWQRILGTVGGVAAGMGLAVIVGGRPALAVAALAVCLFLALYLVRISPALMAFWLTAVLALMYGLIGQFSVATLLLRIEETAVGALMGVLAGFLVFPRRTRDAYAEAHDDLLQAADAVLAAVADRLLGREPPAPPVELARDVDDALSTLRDRTAPLTGPWIRSGGYRDILHALTGVDHYARALARLSDDACAPEWAPMLQPAVDRVRHNLDGLRRTGPPDGDEPADEQVRSAEELIDDAEAWAARCADPDRRHRLLEAARLLRRIDQTVVGLAGVPVVPPASLSRP